FMDAVAVEVHGERRGLDLVEDDPPTALDAALDLDPRQPAADGRRGLPRLLAAGRDTQAVPVVDEHERRGFLRLQVTERRPGGPERLGNEDRPLLHQGAVAKPDLVRLAPREEVVSIVALHPEGALDAVPLLVEGEHDGVDVLRQGDWLALATGDDERAHAAAGLEPVGDD